MSRDTRIYTKSKKKEVTKKMITKAKLDRMGKRRWEMEIIYLLRAFQTMNDWKKKNEKTHS